MPLTGEWMCQGEYAFSVIVLLLLVATAVQEFWRTPRH